VIGLFSGLAQPVLLALDPETAHRLTIRALRFAPRGTGERRPVLARRLWDLDFPNPLGMAAGFDKDAEVPDQVLGLGFGFAEIGTVTPKPQPGNPKPRVFRLTADRGVINRYGFNSGGHEAARRRLQARRGRPGIVGVNIGANKESSDRVADYVVGIRVFYGLASYFTVNVSSPNTPGLRDLQARSALADLLTAVIAERDKQAEAGRKVPVLLKIAPDMAETDLDDVAETALEVGIDGCIVSNTTVSRDGLTGVERAEAGGLSGRPLFPLATRQLARMRLRLGGRMPLVGVGGIDSGETAWQKVLAGADLLQLYTGMVYEGPGLVGRILDHLEAALADRGLARLEDAVGLEAETRAAKSI